jgi:NAD(P)-dependent dehydrogenase (short-subunit alcohol dehydrogenase family)
MTLHGKSVVVIGGTSGLGLSAVRAVCREGGRVVAVGRDPAKAVGALDAAAAGSVRFLAGDATAPETASAAIELALREFGGFDAIYHVAGGSGRRFGDGPLHTITDHGWRHTLAWNLDSAFFSARAAAQSFLDRKVGGSVLVCGSVLGLSPSPRHFATHAYAASKAALAGWIRSLAAYYAPNSIRFNVVAPALVATPMSARAQGDAEILDFIGWKQPLDGGRIGQPEDLDAAVVWLLGDGARFVTGQCLAIDGGWSVTDSPRA